MSLLKYEESVHLLIQADFPLANHVSQTVQYIKIGNTYIILDYTCENLIAVPIAWLFLTE